MKLKLFTLVAIFGLATIKSYAQYITTTQFQNPHSISNDGLLAGYAEWAGPYFVWNADTDVVEVIGGIAPGNNHGGVATFSNDGKYISGTSETISDPTIGEMSRYNTQTKKWERLGFNYDHQQLGSDLSSGYYISGDGKTVVGLAKNANKLGVGFVWNETKGNAVLESIYPVRNSRTNAVSTDGSTIVGWQDIGGPWKGQVWFKNNDGTYKKGQYILIDPKGNSNDVANHLGEARAVSGNGKWIGGRSDAHFPNAWIWSEETGAVDLGTLATPEENNVNSWVTSINYDGSVVLGYTISKQWIDSAPVYKPFIWTKQAGMKDLNDYVANTLRFDMKDDKIYVPTQLSENEKYIAGWGVSPTEIKLFRIQLPAKLSTDDVKNQSEAILYPNPVTNELNINAKENLEQVIVYNLTGQQVLSKIAVSKSAKLDVSNLKSGVYIVEVKTDKSSKTYKIIKK